MASFLCISFIIRHIELARHMGLTEKLVIFYVNIERPLVPKVKIPLGKLI